MSLESIFGYQIEEALKDNYRLYLCGGKEMIQPQLKYISDEQLEIGTSYYRDYTADKPHYHTRDYEYNYVISGGTKVLNLETGEEEQYGENSLFVVSPNTRYASKHLPGTRIIFVKCPKGNDKVVVDIDKKLAVWLENWDAVYTY